jgi:hypothetical protein
MYQEEKLVAIDIGNSHTSIKTTTRIIEFASLVVPQSETEISSHDQEAFKTTFGSYLIGAQFIEEGVKTRSIDSSFYSSESFKVVFLYSLKQAGIKNPVIVTGLPTEFFEDHRKALAKNLRQWATAEGYNIEGVIISRQQSAAFYDPLLLDENGNPVDTKELINGKIGVIDIGYGTIDCGELYNGKLTKKTFGESEGVSVIHKEVLTLLQSPPSSWFGRGKKAGILPEGFSLPKSTNEHTIDKWLREGGEIPFRGEKIDLNPITKESREQYASKTIQRCINNLWGNTDFHNAIIVAGGGATVIGGDILKTKITTKIFIPKDPNLSIVRGLYEYAKLMLKKSNKMAK